MHLADLFHARGTDKECYAPAYEALLRSRRDRIKAVLEIGIGTLLPNAHSSMHGYAADHYSQGGSLRAWRDYFPNAQIVGLDVQPDTQFSEDRIETHLCDSTNGAAVVELFGGKPRFDVIVDDGSHLAEDQLATLRNLFPTLRPEGFYFIEDIGQNSVLYGNPRLVEPFVGRASYFAISDDDGGSDRWKMIVIHRIQ